MIDNNLKEELKELILDYKKNIKRYFDRKGKPISSKELMDLSYIKLKKTRIEDFIVTTFWLGIDHNFSLECTPIIFKTTVFYKGDDEGHELQEEMETCATESEALESHKQMCELVMKYIKDHEDKKEKTNAAKKR